MAVEGERHRRVKKTVSEQSKHSHVKASLDFVDLCRSKAKASALTFQTPCIISFVKRNEATVFGRFIKFPFEGQTLTVSARRLLFFLKETDAFRRH